MKKRFSLLVTHLLERFRAVTTVFENRNLRRLEIAWAAFNIAEYAFVIALGVLAFDRGGAAAVGLMATIAPRQANSNETAAAGSGTGWFAVLAVAFGAVAP